MSTRQLGDDAIIVGTKTEIEAIFGSANDIIVGDDARIVFVPEGATFEQRVEMVAAVRGAKVNSGRGRQ